MNAGLNPVLHHPIVESVLLFLLVLVCWLGALGMWRMREPMQSLHYLSLPATSGSILLVIAVFLEEGNTQISWKTLLMVLILFSINSIGNHASSRAFRTRELGHWEPQEGENLEYVDEQARLGGRQ